ncbi:MAG: S8 family serine peptidase [Candidatus Odinarchaeum yellowstonii]|uniref:S8 family serine peptidase n=1 Tax=Odinarchaeota yellowstonii (strain LCB_4) TaxID=1841599 RepID=A0AAF0IBH7_ODILC|nr:MAG: S8 family serine peptidase [Candidatus Odinarchaeum yellowstonii]
MNKNFLVGLTLIFVLLSSSFILSGVQPASNNSFSNASNIKFNNPLYDKDLEWYLLNYPDSKEIPVIILFKNDTSTALGRELLNLQGYSSLTIKYVYESINGVACKIVKRDLLRLFTLAFIERVYLDREYSFELPESSIASSRIEALYSSGLEAIGALPLQSNYTGSGVKIAIIDSGISLTHPDFKDRVIASRSFVEDENASDLNGHGTHVAGIAAGSGAASNGEYKGVAPGAQLINAKCAQISGIALTSDVIAAIEWSVDQGADVLSISLGGGVGDPNSPLCLAVDWAAEQGVVVSIAAGNSGPDYASVASPAAAKRVIAVGASDYNDRVVDFSSRGPTVDGRISPDLVAPGYEVVSALAKDSVIDLVSQYYLSPDPRIPGTGVYSSGYYYIALSGTSMAAPFVSGAAALLLSAFPNLKGNPEAVKSALINTAVKLVNSSGVEYPPNIQGAGRLNVTAAYYYLLDLNTSTSHIPATSILPYEIPVEPYRIMYPGQEVNLILKFLTGEPLNISIVNSPSNASPFLKFGNSTYLTNNVWNISVINYLDIYLSLKLPLNITPGFYNGRIEIFNSSDSSSLHNVTVSFQAKTPLARVYFDMLHNNDYDDTYLRNYRLFFNILMDDGYGVYSGANLLTYEFLKNFDLIILPDIETQLLNFEVEALHKYVSEGGSLLILGSFYPMTVSESLNNLISAYGIRYSGGYNGNLLKYTDLGLDREYENLIVNNLVSDPITIGVSSYTFGSGISLTVTSPAKTLATLNGKPVLASYDNSSITGGRVVVFSNEITFYSENLNLYGNLRLLRNTVNWLLKEEPTLLTVSAEDTMIQLTGSRVENVYIYLSHNGSFIGGFVSGVNLNATLNGSVNLNVTELAPGVYVTNFTITSPGVYRVDVSVNNGTVRGFDSAQIVAVNSMPAVSSVTFTKKAQPGVTYPSWVELEDFNSSLIISKFGEEMIINVTAFNSNSVLLVANSDPQQFYSLTNRDITYICVNMSYLNGFTWSYTIKPNASYAAASYPVIIIPLNTSLPSLNPSNFILKTILIVGAEPEIDENKTTVNNTPVDNLQKYDIGEGRTLPIFYYSIGTTVQLSTAGSDIQDNLSDMSAYVWIIDALLYYYLGKPIYVIKLEYNSLNQVFAGNLLILSSIISGPAGNLALKSNWAYNMIFFLVNSEGDFSQGPQILLVFQQGFGFLPSPFILILIGLLLITLPFYIMQRRRIRKSMQETEQAYKPYIEEPFLEEATLIPRFCPYCGAKVNPGDIYCLSCGSRLPEEDSHSSL